MCREKIEKLRQEINDMICSENYDYDKLVELSQKLDVLIVEDLKISMYVKKVFGCEVSEQFNKLINKIELVEGNYEYVRIVDPINKEVLSLKGDEREINQFECYRFWGKEKPCEHCVSIKAWEEYSIKIKIEKIKDDIFVLTAVPIQIKEKNLILELIRNVSDNFYRENRFKTNLMRSADMEAFNQKMINEELESLYSRKLIDDRIKVDFLKNHIIN
ncbi:MAG: aspartyl-phosphate phosphatase Spo0E family protein [Clostridiales bacterium]|nr:aspartyl-phosphate phosphatase Spo0E family protein [Clostridiales bacterium]